MCPHCILGTGIARDEGCVALFVCVPQSEEGQEVVRGARMRDSLTGEEWDVRAKVVINATGTCTQYQVHIRTVDKYWCRGVQLIFFWS